jgi:cytochrome P450
MHTVSDELTILAELKQKAEYARRRPLGRKLLRFAVDPSLDPYDIPLADINVANPELMRLPVVLRYFKRLRDEAPIHYCRDSQYGPYWSITRFKDIIEIERMTSVFSSAYDNGGIAIHGSTSGNAEIPMFIAMDPPKHRAQRESVQQRFSAAGLQDLQAEIKHRVVGLLDSLPIGEEFDWVSRVSVELTAQMLTVLLGVDEADRYQLIKWSDIIGNSDNPEVVPDTSAYYEAVHDAAAYFFEHLAHRRTTAPENDLLSLLAHGKSTREMPTREFVGNTIMLMVAGNDTTRNSISGGVMAINEFPAQFELMRNEPRYIETFPPEVIRWQCPLTHMRRNATGDFDYKGHAIKKGDMVILWYLSANRDEDAIERPDEFDLTRQRPNRHLAFGTGPHNCLGRHLAEMQIKNLWGEIMKRYSKIEIVGPVERPSSVMFRAINKLPVKITPV